MWTAFASLFADGWLLARASVTEPLITLRFEGHTEARLKEIQTEAMRRVPALDELMRRHSTHAGAKAPGRE
ncbi:MAG: hypothetical protein PHQ04_00140 [Opitutaceae bacterium]|nr:hypothetical protein [Opitutaceae bacterium]